MPIVTTRHLARCGAAVLVLAVAGCTSTPPPPQQATSTPSPSQAAAPNQIVVAVDEVAGGYNPHVVADRSTTTRALADMMLPSVFRPDAEGDLELDRTLMRAARVISRDPFTVEYVIKPSAAWSDGAPIAAEDFSYLADAMRGEPGTVNPAGYRLIDEVVSRQGGKRVAVRFTDTYPGWRSLFADLVPSHLLKDVPGGWQAAMRTGYPATGGPFVIALADLPKGEILLKRNERYWDKPAAVDQIVLRGSTSREVLDGLRAGTTEFSLTNADGAKIDALRGIATVAATTSTRPEIVELLLRPVGGVLADDTVRAAVAALIDRNALIDGSTAGGPSADLRVDALGLAPGESGYTPTAPEGMGVPDPARAAALLRAAGYARTGDTWTSADGKPLTVRIAAPGKADPYAGIAARLAGQLTAAGLEAEVLTVESREPFAVDPADQDEARGDEKQADIVVAPRVTGTDPATGLASRYGCRESGIGAGTAVEPGNIAGYCDSGVQLILERMLTGDVALSDGLRAVEPRLWAADVVIPLYQLADTLAVSDGVAGVAPGPPLAGPFGSAVNWIRTGG